MINTEQLDSKHKVIAYVKFTNESSNSLSISQQIIEVESWVKRKGYELVKLYQDPVDAEISSDLPGRTELLRELRKRKPEVLVLWKNELLGKDMLEVSLVEREIQLAGTRIESIAQFSGQTDTQMVVHDALRRILDGQGNMKRGLRIKAGIHQNALHCKSNGNNMCFGYRKSKDGGFEIDPITAPIVKKIFADYQSGERTAEIARTLNQSGIRPPRASSFSINALHLILSNPTYAGVYHSGDVVIPGGVPAIIDPDVFESVQLLRESRRRSRKPRASVPSKPLRTYWLRGSVYCGVCGSALTGFSGTGQNGQRYHYYLCPQKKQHRCTKENIPATVLENLVLGQIRHLLSDPVLLRDLATEYLRYYDGAQETIVSLDNYRLRLIECRERIQNIMQAIESGIHTPTIRDRLKTLESEQQMLEDIIQSETRKDREAITEERILHALKDAARIMDQSPEGEMRQLLLRLFIQKIYLYDDRILFHYHRRNGAGLDSDVVRIKGVDPVRRLTV